MTMETLLTAIILAPGAVFLALSLAWLLGWTPPERLIARITKLCYLLMTIGVAWLFFQLQSAGLTQLRIEFGNWFHAGEYEFPLIVLADRLSLPLVGLTSVLVGIVGAFSFRYLHREAGFFRFFVLLHLFAFGSMLIFTAGSYDLLTAGWELVGITSVLLIAFFGERRDPVRNALRVFAMYRISDLGLLLVLFVFHYNTGSAVFGRMFSGEWPNQSINMSPDVALLAGFLLLFAAAGKSALIPFSGWLPRAMEGPTPSSAIFYGAISVHCGVYLLLRAAPILASSIWVSAAVVIVGLASAVLGTMAHRVASDAKTALAFASMTQAGLIAAEVGLGFYWLALFHILGHAILRTLQFLRAPSMLHDYHRVHAAAGGELASAGETYLPVPRRFEPWLFRVASELGFYDTILDRYVVAPILRAARWLLSFEPGEQHRDTLPPSVPHIMDHSTQETK